MSAWNDSGPEPRIFAGEALREIAFPLGGIGTGSVSLGGRGDLRDWEIFNRPGKGKHLPYTFFALWAQAEGAPSIARVLEQRLMPPYSGGFGLPTARVSGLPRLERACFRGAYPIARIDFADESLPVTLSLTAFNPMIPLDAERSGLPVAIFVWEVANPQEVAVAGTIAFSLLNACGYDGQATLGNRRHALFGGNLDEWTTEAGMAGIRMSTRRYPPDHAQFGTLALATPWPDLTWSLRWERAGWWDDLQNFWDDFAADGRLPDTTAADPSPDGETDVATLGLRFRLAPGESVQLPFVLAWHFPNLTNTWNREEGVRGRRLGNYYATRFADAWAAARAAIERLDALSADTRAFQRALLESTLPAPVRDAVSSQISILRTTTCLRTEDGRFHAFEGCHDNAGCCPMNCTHVWNYEQALAFLYPELERTMRLTDFGINTRPDGRMAFRTLLPLAPETLWGGPPAADGQMGCLLKLYREWQIGGETGWLRELWPHARRALEFAWQKWDRDRDGVMEGEQHNTYDIEFYGPNTMVGTLYLGALRAAAEMADAVGDRDFAAECRALAERGRAGYETLWNGEYYAQRVLPPAGPAEGLGAGTQSLQASGELRYQFGDGCLSDQLLGQWFARVVGLGHLLDPDRVRQALAAIFRSNFRRGFFDHANCQRIYALNDEAGLLLCSWPRGGRPAYPFPYADEVWTGIEYQVAGHCIYEGLVEEGLAIVRAARERYDGVRRNPWDEVECGHHYARALAVWSVWLALTGFEWSAVEGRIGFAPRRAGEAFRCFYCAGTGWGTYAQHTSPTGSQHDLAVTWGRLTLREIRLPAPASSGEVAATLLAPEGAIAATLAPVPPLPNGLPQVAVRLPAPVTLSAGERLRVQLTAG